MDFVHYGFSSDSQISVSDNCTGFIPLATTTLAGIYISDLTYNRLRTLLRAAVTGARIAGFIFVPFWNIRLDSQHQEFHKLFKDFIHFRLILFYVLWCVRIRRGVLGLC